MKRKLQPFIIYLVLGMIALSSGCDILFPVHTPTPPPITAPTGPPTIPPTGPPTASPTERPAAMPAGTITYMLVDDYEQLDTEIYPWYYTNISTDRRKIGGEGAGDIFTVDIIDGKMIINVTSGWGGICTSLIHNEVIPQYFWINGAKDSLDFQNPLGPFIREEYQPAITGMEIHLLDGSGNLKLELKDQTAAAVQTVEWSEIIPLIGGPMTIYVNLPPLGDIKLFNCLIDGPGFAEVDYIYFTSSIDYSSVMEYVFLFSYGHLSQCYDQINTLVRERSHWPVLDLAAMQALGTFSLVTALAADLEYVLPGDAAAIIQDINDKIVADIPLHISGLLPHYLTNGQITLDEEWSSIDTILCLIGQLLANQAFDIETLEIINMINDIDWAVLSQGNTLPVSMGYTYDGSQLLSARWDTFGSESFIIGTALAAATGELPVLVYENPPTHDGSGFNDEMAALFFPMTGTDAWGNDWEVYRREAVEAQLNYFIGHPYHNLGWFGLSAAEVPAPPEVESDYGAWGTGGREPANDGSIITGYPFIAPHYAALIASEYPLQVSRLFISLAEDFHIFSPLNTVESVGLDGDGNLKLNSLKGAWNLVLQALGAARALSGDSYLPYTALEDNAFLNSGFHILMSEE